MFDMIEQQFKGSKINHLFGGSIGYFVVPCESTKSVQPGESAFHHPSKRFWSKSICSVWSGTNLDIEITLYILNKLAAVSAVDKSFPDRRPCVGDLFSDRRCEPGVVYSGTADISAEDESVAVNSDIAFYTFHLFIGVETVVALAVAPLDALSVKCHYRWGGGLPAFATYLHDEFFYTVIQIPFRSPFVEVPVHCLPFGKVVWEHTPLASTDRKIQNSLEYGAQRIFTMSAIIFKEYFVYIRPLTLGQMCLIEAVFMHTNLFLLQTL